MKKFILALALTIGSVTAFSQSYVQPRISQWGSQIQVEIFNHTDYAINCSGWINMNYYSGRFRTEYFNEYVSSRFHSYRTIYNRDWRDRIMNISHSIYCY